MSHTKKKESKKSNIFIFAFAFYILLNLFKRFKQEDKNKNLFSRIKLTLKQKEKIIPFIKGRFY